jgi:CspA family cold shock protein
MKGKVKWYNPRKAYGFIVGEDEKEYFAHQTELPNGYIEENDEVEFEAEATEKGLNAKKVKKI